MNQRGYIGILFMLATVCVIAWLIFKYSGLLVTDAPQPGEGGIDAMKQAEGAKSALERDFKQQQY